MALLARDRDRCDLEAIYMSVEKELANVPTLAKYITTILRSSLPEIWEIGYRTGASAGIELSEELVRDHISEGKE